MTTFLSVTNWRRYQHYKDRTPVWIKLHLAILTDEKLKRLPISTRLLWDQMLLLAATFQNSVPNSPELIANLTGIPPEDCREGIELLLKGRWLREKQTRRSASRAASVEKEVRKEEDKEKRAREKATTEAAERFVVDSAYWLDDKRIQERLKIEFGITDEHTLRRLIARAGQERVA